jgi:hypothetical protein
MVLLTYWASDHIFFWDTISQGSRLVDFYYQTNFQQLFLPTEIDQGHPPLFQIYIALGWKLFGRTLFVSHFLMLPILIGIVWQIFQLVQHFFDKKHHWIALALPFFDTTFLAQNILVSPDVLLLFAFLMSLNGLLKRKNWMIIIGSLLLGLTSIRGIVMVGVLYIIQIFLNKDFFNSKNIKDLVSTLFKKLIPFIPAIFLVSFYLIFHFIETGWWISTPSESWNTQRGFVGIFGVLKNIGIAGWRLLDFGKFGTWIVIGIFLFRVLLNRPSHGSIRSKTKSTQLFEGKKGKLLIILCTFLLVNIGLFMWFSNPLAHRYFLPAFVIKILLIGYLLLEMKIFKNASKYVLGGVLILMFSGNFWVYPNRIAQGWDSTMAHIPYYELREEMINYMIENDIPFEETKSWFPNKSNFDELDLTKREFGMNYEKKDTPKYLFYSNVMNDIPDRYLTQIQRLSPPTKKMKRNGVKIILYGPLK